MNADECRYVRVLDDLGFMDRKRSPLYLTLMTRLKWKQGCTAKTAHWRLNRKGFGGWVQVDLQRRRWTWRNDRLEDAAGAWRKR